MYLSRKPHALVLGSLLLLMIQSAEARRPGGGDDGGRYERAQSDARDDRRFRDDRRGGEDAGNQRGRDNRDEGGYYPQRPAEPRGRSLSDAVTEAERRTGGRVLSAEPRSEGGQVYYRVKVLGPDGRVQILNLDR